MYDSFSDFYAMCRYFVLCLCFVVLVSFGSTQDAIDDTASEAIVQSEVVPTDLICKTCSCRDGLVDCSGRSLQASFQLADWAGLKGFGPITVDMSNNQLSFLTTISELPIQNLTLSHCEIDKIESNAMRNLRGLVILDLSYNRLSTSSLHKRVFGCGMPQPGHDHPEFWNLRTLSLASNDIHSLPQDLFHAMSDLTSLDLSGNPLAYIDQVTMAAITALTKLKELKLSGCELETLPEGLFRRQRRLERLDLSDNRFTMVPAVLGEPVNLVYLRLSKNPIVNITEKTAISNLSKLQELHLCRLSKLESISEGALGGLSSLVALHLCFNPRLTNLDSGFLMWTDDHDVERYPLLRTLHLQSNNLSEINSHYLDRWDQLSDVDFTNNPYECDCDAQWMVDVLMPLVAASARNDTADNMFCKKPQDLRGLSLSQLNSMSKTLTCPESEDVSFLPGPDAAIILGIMIGIFATFPLVFVLVLLWRKGYFARCQRKAMKTKHDEDEEEAF